MLRRERTADCDCAFERFCERGCCRTHRLRSRGGVVTDLWAAARRHGFDQRWQCWLSALRRDPLKG